MKFTQERNRSCLLFGLSWVKVPGYPRRWHIYLGPWLVTVG